SRLLFPYRSRGSERHSRSSRCPKIRTRPPLLNSRKPAVSDSPPGASTGAGLTKACVEFCRALALTRFDVLGFSLGGMIAQQLAADHPEMVRRIILSGTGPRGGEGMVFEDLSAVTM